MDSGMPPLVHDPNNDRFEIKDIDPEKRPEVYNVSATTQVIAVPKYGIDARISNLNSSIDGYIEERESIKARRCLKRIEVWEKVTNTFQTEVLPEDALNGKRAPYTPTNEDSVDAVLIPRVWLEHKIEQKQEKRNMRVREDYLGLADHSRVQREVYEEYILKRNAEFTVQTDMLNVGVVEKIEELE
jgi:hypothetical protein